MGEHWRRCKAKGIPLEAAIVIGVVPAVAYAATSKLPYDFDEYRLAGGLAGEPIEVVRCQTVDLHVPATAEIVIEGKISTEWIEPEGPFGEYPGYMGHRGVAPFMDVTCIHSSSRGDLHGVNEPVSAQRKQQDQTHRNRKSDLQISPFRQR